MSEDLLHYKVAAWLERQHGVITEPGQEKFTLIADKNNGYMLADWQVKGVRKPDLQDFMEGRVRVSGDDISNVSTKYQQHREKLQQKRKQTPEYYLVKALCNVLKLDFQQLEQQAAALKR